MLKLVEHGTATDGTKTAQPDPVNLDSSKSPIYSQPFIQPNFVRGQSQESNKAQPKPALNETYSCPLPPQQSQYRYSVMSPLPQNNQTIQSPTASTTTLVSNQYSNGNQTNGTYHRSLSEPRHNPISIPLQRNQQDYPQSYMNQENSHYKQSCFLETYDNLSEQMTNKAENIDSKCKDLVGVYERFSRGNYDNGRDLRSAERDVGGHVARKLYQPTSKRVTPTQVSRDMRSCERDISGSELNPRSGSQTPRLAMDEDDDTSISQASYATLKSNGDPKIKCDEHDLLDSLDENDIDNFETSKMKMKLMQKQLQTLTNLVHQALINRDLNQLAAQYSMQSIQSQALDQAWQKTNDTKKPQKEASKTGLKLANNLKELSSKTGTLKNELGAIRKLHENLSSTFTDSMKTFATQLNVSLSYNFF